MKMHFNTPVQSLDENFSNDSGKQLLMVLRILECDDHQNLLIAGTAQWNKRRDLGKGFSFAVEEVSLPV